MTHLDYASRAALLSTVFLFFMSGSAVGDLVAFWSFDDETATDLSGNGNDGEVIDLGFSSDTPTGAGRSLEVVDGGTVQVAHTDSIGMADTMSIAFWMKADNFEQEQNWNGPMGKIEEPRTVAGWEFQRFDAQSRLDIRIDTDAGNNSVKGNLTGTYDEEWVHVAWTVDVGEWASYLDGELIEAGSYPHGDGFANEADLSIGDRSGRLPYTGLLDEIGIWDNVLSDDEIFDLAQGIPPVEPGGKSLWAGDADQDFDFDQLDLVQVQIAAKYLTGQAATWGEGDWDGAPGGEQGNPPAGNGFFDQLDIIGALGPSHYLTGPYAAIQAGGAPKDEQTSLVYNTNTGELGVDSPADGDLTSINITSAGNKFIGNKPAALDGAFDNFAADNIFKATFGGSFGDISFGNVLPTGLSEADVAADLSAVGSLAGGGDLGEVDLVYIPEPIAAVLFLCGILGLSLLRRR